MLRNLVLDSFIGSRVRIPLEAKIIEKIKFGSRESLFSFLYREMDARCLLQRATSDVVHLIHTHTDVEQNISVHDYRLHRRWKNSRKLLNANVPSMVYEK